MPAFTGDWQLAAEFKRVSTITVLWHWTDANLLADGLILAPEGSEAGVTWNRPWSGYDGVTSFQWWLEPVTGEYSPVQYLARGIKYLVVTDTDLKRFTTAEQRALLNKLTLLKTIQTTALTAGPTIYFYAMQTPTHIADASFGNQIKLVGYDLAESSRMISFRPYWRIEQRPMANYSVFMHLYPMAADPGHDPMLAQYDGAPTTPQRLTLTWDDSNELYLGPKAILPLPAPLKPGTYRLDVGLYDFLNGQRLHTMTGDDSSTILIQIGITPNDPTF